MNNIIKTQMFIMKQKIVSLTAVFIAAVVVIVSGFLLNPNPAETLTQPGFMAMFIVLFIPIMVISYSYSERIQMYEIMAGFRPHQIILGKTLVILPPLLAFLAASAIVSLINDSSQQTLERLLLYCILCVRATLCIVFLSPVLKIGTFAPVFSVMLLMVNGSDTEALAHSPLSLLCFGQCTLLIRDITDGFVIKVIISAIVSCTIYYLIGYFTLKKKIELEPHPIS
ncbi:hypothetical protein [Ruminococcus albus]|uniref:ABC-2 family transporter protein n=1 Tax=Ruminococcus albus TaxID=1264 RepID=A0A1I1QRT5_RUMAL|nr:hypothetical protein [Ruminococcus albus]SFD24831.1 hypothetical protein SAMN02910406_03490 [Ruminococcus albus]